MTRLLREAGAALLLVVAQTAAAGSLTLPAAVDEALARNPSLAAAGARQEEAIAREAESRASRLPRIDAGESVTRSNNPVFVFGSLLEQGRFGPQNFDPAFLNAPAALTNYRSFLTARVALFDRFHAATTVRQSANAVTAAAAEVEEARQRLRAEVIARFYGVVVAGENVAVARESVAAAEADAKATRDRFEQGMLVESDALSADVQLATFRQRLIAAEGDLAVARAALSTLLQRPLKETVTIRGALLSVPAGDVDLDDAIARAIVRRASVKVASLAMSDATLRLRAERGAALPRVDAFGTYGASGSSIGRHNGDYIGGISMTIDLFDRGRPARIAAARAGIHAANAGEVMARDAVTMEVVTAWNRLHVARESSAVAASSVEHAQSAARIVRDRYEQGLTTITEQLRAQTALASARFDLLAARYESLLAHAELLRTTGDLDDVQSFL